MTRRRLKLELTGHLNIRELRILSISDGTILVLTLASNGDRKENRTMKDGNGGLVCVRLSAGAVQRVTFTGLVQELTGARARAQHSQLTCVRATR